MQMLRGRAQQHIQDRREGHRFAIVEEKLARKRKARMDKLAQAEAAEHARQEAERRMRAAIARKEAEQAEQAAAREQAAVMIQSSVRGMLWMRLVMRRPSASLDSVKASKNWFKARKKSTDESKRRAAAEPQS